MNSVLLGGSCKRLYQHLNDATGPPLATAPEDDPDVFITAADDVKSHMRSYFDALFTRQPRPPALKPWLTTPSVMAICQRTAHDPFNWPQLMSLSDLRLLLRRGKP
ncbi:hypothetical protein SCP_0407050 [Sparassis crispa]|uniref:Uncharacterized protein n=1 Tax=Sparassis crispa TaxID=139825 RepID=A0A401GJI4_9APHY|nr:hypothetical protein SCP_0407050 [Sparassis crispa]GBE82321.1 hypothetical protein SCP_0407050 [Sparassis crispa]